jgi:hypothetical protein
LTAAAATKSARGCKSWRKQSKSNNIIGSASSCMMHNGNLSSRVRTAAALGLIVLAKDWSKKYEYYHRKRCYSVTLSLSKCRFSVYI